MNARSLPVNLDKPLFGITLMLLAFLLFSLIDASAKWLAVAGLPALQIAFMRYAGASVIAVARVSRQQTGFDAFRTDYLWLTIVRALALAAGTLLNFIALRYIPLTLTATIMFAAPIMVCALSGMFLGERVGIWRWSAILFGFVGVLIAMRPFDSSFHWAILLSLGTAFGFTTYSLLTRKLAGKVAVDTQQLYSAVVGTVILAPGAFLTWQIPDTTIDWVIILAIGPIAWLGHEIMTRAHRYAPASTLAPYIYTLLVYMTIWSMLWFDHFPDQWTLTGALIIISSGLVIWFRERRNVIAA